MTLQVENGDQLRTQLQQELEKRLILHGGHRRTRLEQLPSPTGAKQIEGDGDQGPEKRLLVGVRFQQLVKLWPVQSLVGQGTEGVFIVAKLQFEFPDRLFMLFIKKLQPNDPSQRHVPCLGQNQADQGMQQPEG